MELNGPVKISGHSNSFFSVRPAKGAREKITGAASDCAAWEGDGSVLTVRAKVTLVQGQFTLGIPSASPIRKSIS